MAPTGAARKYAVKTVSLDDGGSVKARAAGGRVGPARSATPPGAGQYVVTALSEALALDPAGRLPALGAAAAAAGASPTKHVAQALANMPATQAAAAISSVAANGLDAQKAAAAASSLGAASPAPGMRRSQGNHRSVDSLHQSGMGAAAAAAGAAASGGDRRATKTIRHYNSNPIQPLRNSQLDALHIEGISRSRSSPEPVNLGNKVAAGTLHVPTRLVERQQTRAPPARSSSPSAREREAAAATAAAAVAAASGGSGHGSARGSPDSPSTPQNLSARLGTSSTGKKAKLSYSAQLMNLGVGTASSPQEHEFQALRRERDALKNKIKTLEANAARFQISAHVSVKDAGNARLQELSAQLEHLKGVVERLSAENDALKVSKRRPSFQLPAPSSAELLEPVTSLSAQFRQMVGEILLDVATAPIHQMNAAIERLIDETYTVVRAHRISFFLVHGPTQTLVCHTSKDKAVLDPVRLPLNGGIVGSVVSSGEPINIANAYEDERFAGVEIDRLTGQRTGSLLGVPVFDSDDEVIGVVQAMHRRGNSVFSSEDEDNMLLLARAISLCMGRIRDDEIIQKAQRRMEVLTTVSKTVSTTHNADAAVAKITEVAYQAVSADRVSIFLVDTVQQELWCKVSKDLHTLSVVRIPIGHGILGTVALTGQAINIPDAYHDARFNKDVDQKTGYRTKSLLAVPVCDRENKPIAVIQAINKMAQRFSGPGARKEIVPFDEDDEMLMTALASEISTMIKNNFLNSVVRKLLVEPETEDDYARHLRGLLAEFVATDRRVAQSGESRAGTPVLGGKNPLHRLRTPVRQHTQQFDLSKTPLPAAGSYMRLRHWDFDIIGIPEDQLANTALEIFRLLKFDAHLDIPQERLAHFVHRIGALYNANPFHNFRHAVQVLHCVFLFLTTTNLMHFLTLSDAFALCCAAICHDLDHRGVNNAFEVASQSRLAILYNDQSVLENHHCHMMFKILGEDDCNILQSLEKEFRGALRSTIITSILSTDMAQHASLLGELGTASQLSRANFDDRLLLVRIVLHAADISNPVLPREQMRPWADLVMQEFNQQADLERENGLPVSTFMIRHTDAERSQLQMDFLDYVVVPLFRKLADVLSGLDPCLEAAADNRKYWQQIHEGCPTTKAKAALAKELSTANDEAAKEPSKPHEADTAGEKE